MFDVVVCCASSVYLWLRIQSLVDDVSVLVWRVYTRQTSTLICLIAVARVCELGENIPSAFYKYAVH